MVRAPLQVVCGLWLVASYLVLVLCGTCTASLLVAWLWLLSCLTDCLPAVEHDRVTA